ncbi:MAG: sigma-54-dependent transcriptional regulator [Saprospiraceae bacterium]
MARDHTIRVFIVEDDPVYQRFVRYVVELDSDYEVHVFANGKDCLANLHLKPNIISLDYTLPDMTGEEVLQRIKSFDQEIGVIILSGQQDIGTAVKLLREGAFDYLVKDSETKERLQNTLSNIKKQIGLKREVDTLKAELVEKYDFSKHLIGHSPAMLEVYHLIEKAVKSNINVSIQGESGTGKEVVAKSIHHNSPRRNGPFVALNMSAIPRELLESELFGHEKGAFTGAVTRKKGQFELSNGGTLFLDEIAELDISIQSKLLRAIQEREFIRVGGESPIPFNARLIVATHKNLAEEVQNGNFREDLYYRLLGLSIHLPPLRERGNDILLLAKNFLAINAIQRGSKPMELTKEAEKKLLSYAFPGNVRELIAIIELASVMADGTLIEAENLQFSKISKGSDFFNHAKNMEEFKADIIQFYLRKHQGNVQEVAKKLDIGKSSIYRLLKQKK